MSSFATSSPAGCPACGYGPVRIFYEAQGVPVNSVLLLADREQALRFPTGDIRLAFCERCGFICNSAFERGLVEYSSDCEETQGFSPFFRDWQKSLARQLIDRHALHGKTIIEIGCGKGEFLGLLCELGNNRGVGFDPAYRPGRISADAAGRIRFIPDFYAERYKTLKGDFVCCKMTLEHIADAGSFVGMVHRSLQGSPDARVFFQVPDVSRILEEGAFWDIYYEHCSYFTAGSLRRLFRNAGFDVLKVGCEYCGQYVTIEARVGDERAPLNAGDDLIDLKGLVDRFQVRVPGRIAEWRTRLTSYHDKGLRTVIWGAGSKGVSFISTINVPGAIEYAVDINPNMAAHYLAKTGVEIIAPAVLREYRPDVVIVMNPVYRKEISAELGKLGLNPEVVET